MEQRNAKMTTGKIFTIVFRVLVIPVALVVTLVTLLSSADITIPLEGVRKQFVAKATETVGHDVHIDGEVRLAISFFPTLVVDQLHISNEPRWSSKDILSIDEIRVQLALLPILSGQLEFVEISAAGIQVNLEQASDGSQNWALLLDSDDKIAAPDNSSEKEPITSGKSESGSRRIWIEEFRLSDINVNYTDEYLKREFNHKIDKLVINTRDKSYLTANIQGTAHDMAYAFSAKSDLLRNLTEHKPWHMEMRGQIAEKPVTLDIKLKIDKSIDGTISLNTQGRDIGKILSMLGLVKGIDAYSKTLALDADLKGRTLKEFLEKSIFKVSMHEGYWNLHSPGNNQSRKIIFSTATLLSELGQPVKLEFTGEINEEPVQLELASNNLSDFVSKPEKIHLDLDATFSHSTIKLKSDIDVPVSSQTFRTALFVSGKRLDSWNKILKVDIPPFGPYKLSGNFSIDSAGFRVRNLKTNIGSSNLGGEIFVKTEGNKTHWKLNLDSQNFQIDDFNIEGFSLIPATANDPELGKKPSIKEDRKDPAINMLTEKLKESKKYPGIDVELQLKANKVYSGSDFMGGGDLHLKASENSLSIDTFHLDLPGGFMDGALEIQLQGNDVKGRLKLDMDKFNYGVIYRHFYPESVADGLISTRVDLQLAGDDFKHSLNHANGQLDLAFWPKNIEAKILNMWSVNLLLAILPELKKQESKMNCGVALLDIEDGKLSEELLVIDTSKIWMNGNIRVNFPMEEVSLTLFPKAKKAKIFGLQAPIRIKGTFDELRLSIRAIDILSSYVSFITSPLHAPFRRMFGKNVPEDASHLCEELLDREHIKAVLEEMKKESPTLDDMYNYD